MKGRLDVVSFLIAFTVIITGLAIALPVSSSPALTAMGLDQARSQSVSPLAESPTPTVPAAATPTPLVAVATSTPEPDWNTIETRWYGQGLYGGKMADGGILKTTTKAIASNSLPLGTMVDLQYGHRPVVTAQVRDRHGPSLIDFFDLTAALSKEVFGTPGNHTVKWRLSLPMTSEAAPEPTPEPAATDPAPGGCWTYDTDGVTVIVMTPDECLAIGVDPAWTPDPLWTQPPDWVHCWAIDPDTGDPLFEYWQAGPCPEPDPTP